MACGRDFVHRFQGRAILAALLEAAGSPCSPEEVANRMREARRRGGSASSVIPGLFLREPRFPDPSHAQQLYENLLGLWNLTESGETFSLEKNAGPTRTGRPRPPPPFGEVGPDTGFVEASGRFLAALDKRGLNRLQDRFENGQDVVLGFLEEQGLSQNCFASARGVLFELFAIIELGWPPGTRPVSRAELFGRRLTTREAPEALRAYAEKALFEAEQDDDSPRSPDESTQVRELVSRGLRALWTSRRTK